jgi:hypothetical protein
MATTPPLRSNNPGSASRGVIVARVQGGLGNQLFIYSAAAGIAAKFDRQLSLDTVSAYTADRFDRHFLLDKYRIRANPASGFKSFAYPGACFTRKAAKLINRSKPLRDRTYLYEKHLSPLSLLTAPELRQHTYLDGYWQQYVYFDAIADALRKDLTLTGPLSYLTAALGTLLTSQECSVAVHVRGHPGASATGAHIATLPALTERYYAAALSCARSRLTNPHFYIFTDGTDAKWLPSLFSDATVLEGANLRADYEDLWLMSKCKHHIIANSTFSWWGAWLQSRFPHLVLTPRMARYGQQMTVPHWWSEIDE